MKKIVNKYAKIYKNSLIENDFSNIDEKVESYEHRLLEMYNSQAYAKHNIYSTMDMAKIYAVIAMCLELKKENISNKEIIDIINCGFRKLKRILATIEKITDSLPNAYSIVRKWNVLDNKNRKKDGSITYNYFNVSDNKIEYQISKCMYVEIFKYYGIRELCKIFCMTDESAYANLQKHVKFIRHSDLSDGNCCHDEVLKKN